MPVSPMEVVLLVVVGFLLFGASRLPKVGRSLGEGLRGFGDGLLGRGEKVSELER